MAYILVHHLMALQALLRACSDGLGACGGDPHLMNVVAGSTGHAFGNMPRIGPVNELLVVALGKLIGVKMVIVAGCEGGRAIIRFQCSSRLVADRPPGLLVLRGPGPSIVARSADLHCHTLVSLAGLTMVSRFSKTAVLGKAACQEPLPWQASQAMPVS